MKRFLFFMAVAIQGIAVSAQTADSLWSQNIEKVVVLTSRATATTPVAYTNISGEQLNQNGEDIPYLLKWLPSVTIGSESGIGFGNTSIKIRGTDATRINVTMNGVPLNDAESHAVYWYDTPDIASSVGSVQVQRGAGTSSVGTGSFGGAINFESAPLSPVFGGSASLSYGSYNTQKESVSINSGRIGKWIIGGRLSHIASDGYVDRATTSMNSYLFQAGYFTNRTSIKLLSFGGKSKVGLAYTGLTKEEIAINRHYNPEGEMKDSEGNVIGFYQRHRDNYLQINNQAIINHNFGGGWSLTTLLHYTYGNGYYQNYKNDQKLKKYNLPNGITIADQTLTRTNLIRRKNMRNDFGGIVATAGYNSKRVALQFGISGNIYDGVHFGQIVGLPLVTDFEKIEYYRNYTRKYDASIFARVDWTITKGVNLFADLQYRHITHKIHGVNDNYDDTTSALQKIEINRKYDFVNPKLGISYSPANGHQLYFSVAVAQKEPTRNNFTDIKSGEYPTAERMIDFEWGYRYQSKLIEAGANFYYMVYKDQLVQTGELSDTGELLARNIPHSFRRGIELELVINPISWFSFGANATLSQNRVKNYTDYVDDCAFERGQTTLAYSPSIIAGTMFDFHTHGFEATLNTRYVSKQYLTNGEYEDLTLDRYCVTDLNLAYTLKTKKINSIRFGVAINNLFNTKYCNNGYGGSWMEGTTLADRKSWSNYFPQALLNVVANVTIKF